MIEKILGNKTAEIVMLFIYHYGEIYPSAISKESKIALNQIQKQLERFEDAGVLCSKLLGRTRVYSFNPKSPLLRPFKELIKLVYDAIPLAEKENLFKKRFRPRRKGKSVIKSLKPIKMNKKKTLFKNDSVEFFHHFISWRHCPLGQ